MADGWTTVTYKKTHKRPQFTSVEDRTLKSQYPAFFRHKLTETQSRLGLTQPQLAEKLGVNTQILIDIENNQATYDPVLAQNMHQQMSRLTSPT